MRKLIALMALVATAACSLNTATDQGPLVGNLEGTYTLQAMNGTPMPFSFTLSDTTIVFDTTDVLIVSAGGGWSETGSYRQTVGTNPTTNESFDLAGSWSRSGNSLNFRTTQGVLLYVGTATDTTLVLADRNFTYLFKR